VKRPRFTKAEVTVMVETFLAHWSHLRGIHEELRLIRKALEDRSP